SPEGQAAKEDQVQRPRYAAGRHGVPPLRLPRPLEGHDHPRPSKRPVRHDDQAPALLPVRPPERRNLDVPVRQQAALLAGQPSGDPRQGADLPRVQIVRRRPHAELMLISTMNDIPGRQVVEVYGEVMGLTVRSRNIGSQIGAGFKSLVGGELKGMTKALQDSRNQVIERMVAEAEAKGADAVLAMRFDTSELGSTWTEICAYGTAVKTQAI